VACGRAGVLPWVGFKELVWLCGRLQL
jgi:hypothetical protein